MAVHPVPLRVHPRFWDALYIRFVKFSIYVEHFT